MIFFAVCMYVCMVVCRHAKCAQKCETEEGRGLLATGPFGRVKTKTD